MALAPPCSAAPIVVMMSSLGRLQRAVVMWWTMAQKAASMYVEMYDGPHFLHSKQMECFAAPRSTGL